GGAVTPNSLGDGMLTRATTVGLGGAIPFQAGAGAGASRTAGRGAGGGAGGGGGGSGRWPRRPRGGGAGTGGGGQAGPPGRGRGGRPGIMPGALCQPGLLSMIGGPPIAGPQPGGGQPASALDGIPNSDNTARVASHTRARLIVRMTVPFPTPRQDVGRSVFT